MLVGKTVGYLKQIALQIARSVLLLPPHWFSDLGNTIEFLPLSLAQLKFFGKAPLDFTEPMIGLMGCDRLYRLSDLVQGSPSC